MNTKEAVGHIVSPVGIPAPAPVPSPRHGMACMSSDFHHYRVVFFVMATTLPVRFICFDKGRLLLMPGSLPHGIGRFHTLVGRQMQYKWISPPHLDNNKYRSIDHMDVLLVFVEIRHAMLSHAKFDVPPSLIEDNERMSLQERDNEYLGPQH